MFCDGIVRWLKKRKLFVLLVVFTFIVSGLITNFLELCTLPLLLVSKRLFRLVNTKLVYLHWCSKSIKYVCPRHLPVFSTVGPVVTNLSNPIYIILPIDQPSCSVGIRYGLCAQLMRFLTGNFSHPIRGCYGNLGIQKDNKLNNCLVLYTFISCLSLSNESWHCSKPVVLSMCSDLCELNEQSPNQWGQVVSVKLWLNSPPCCCGMLSW